MRIMINLILQCLLFLFFLAIRASVFMHIIYLELCLVYMWIGIFACLFTLHMGYGNKPKNTSRW